ncbi:coiled-coil domain-containing protein mad1 [Tulasnella sp. 403]|nr:coiled-coil domain-containing protein mad1 [Tulasnella sp. 403]
MDRRSTLRNSTVKRDSFAAQLDQDPQLSSSRRAQKADLFSSRMATKSLERQLLAAENAKHELESALKEKEIAIERLGNERRWLSERETEEREERKRLAAEWSSEKKDLERSLRAFRTNLTTLQAEHADLSDIYAELQRTTTSTINTQVATITTLERKVAFLEDELNRTRNLAQQQKDSSRQLQEKLEELENDKDALSGRSNSNDESWRIIRDEMHRQNTYFKNLEATNAKLTAEVHSLRAKNASVEVLREEKRVLERKLSKATEQEEQLARLEGEVEAARKEREAWAAFLANPDAELSSSTPVAHTQVVSDLRLKHATLLEQYGSATSLLAHREAEINTLRDTITAQTSRIEELSSSLGQEEERSQRAQRRLALAERETSGLKALLATYEAEEARYGENENGERVDNAKVQKIELLESTLSDLRTAHAELEAKLTVFEARQSPSTSPEALADLAEKTSRVKELEEELTDALAASDRLLDKVSTLEQELYELGAAINAGNHIPPNTRVVQFTANPIRNDLDLKREVFDRLRQENDALLERLADVERSHDVPPGSALVPRESWENLLREKEDMIKTVADKEKRLLRLKQVFTAKTEEFRQAVSSILGYTLFFQPTKIRLTSTYDIAAAITFQLNASSRTNNGNEATMKLLGAGNGDEGLTPRLNELINYWIVERDSIPCFMAAVTLECFERSLGPPASTD